MTPLVKCSYCLLMKCDFIYLQIFIYLFIPNANYPAPNSDPSLLASTKLYKDTLINLFGAQWKFTSTWLLLSIKIVSHWLYSSCFATTNSKSGYIPQASSPLPSLCPLSLSSACSVKHDRSLHWVLPLVSVLPSFIFKLCPSGELNLCS